MALATNKTDIKEFSRETLVSWLEARKVQSYRAGQILRWVYQRQADTFEEMTDLGNAFRKELSGSFVISRLKTASVSTSRDGSKKFLFRLCDGRQIESVLIPEKDHYTLCVSSQAGCAQGCRFCLTARSGFERNLTQGEIVAQVRDIAATLDEHDTRRLTNIVFMGMGEPLANYGHVAGAITTLCDRETGMGFSSRKITLSTAGVVPNIARLGRHAAVNLAVSLNASDNRTRDMLMPLNRKYPLEMLIKACRRYPLKPGRRITFEYILLKGINDSQKDARCLANLLKGVRCKINLIPFNEHQGCDFKRPEESSILAFQETLRKRHYVAVIRRSKGLDISAACGQLQADSARQHVESGRIKHR
jgi:23S rRNA (adenine2503-C2)-methyltransferase